MEIFMKGVSWSASHTDVVLLLAGRLHHADFNGDEESDPFNFHVHLLRDKTRRQPHAGSGFLTLPTTNIGERFLKLFGASGLVLHGRKISFSPSKSQTGRSDVIQSIIRMPYIDPRILEQQEKLSRELAASRVAIGAIQFGWDCRDQVLSIESEASPPECFICFDEERRQFRIEFMYDRYKHYIAIRFSNIEYLTAHQYLQRDPAVVFTLLEPPTYEKDLKPRSHASLDEILSMLSVSDSELDKGPVRSQLSFLPLPENHEQIGKYTCLALRLVCKSNRDLEKFKELSRDSGFSHIASDPYPIERRALFSQDSVDEYNRWIRQLPWAISFQVQAIVLKRSVDIREMLDLLPDIKRLLSTKGRKYTALFLQDFAPKVYALYRSEDDGADAVRRCFEAALQESDSQPPRRTVKPTDGSIYEAYHATITPTTIVLDGPYAERSNRVIRAYNEKHHESFIRVTFAEEGRLQFRFDKDVDSRAYIQSRIGPILLNGLTIASRKFEFLAYSQSALKEHSVWFVKPFKVKEDPPQWVRARDIIASLGSFENLRYDPELIRCPARYAARLSQAFTATDASVSVNVEEIFKEDDIEVVTEGQKFNFTDGVGTMSKTVAQEIWRKLKRTRRRLRSVKGHPSAYQVRFMGSKGMLSVDHMLSGRAVVLRPSMIKFEAPEARDLEIARAFDRPTPYFLNRPLITIMEGLGVKYETFRQFQEAAVQETEGAAYVLSKAGKLLECYGLGSPFRLSSVMNSLEKLGISSLIGDKFYDKSMEFAKNHILRLLKNHARIPIPGAWTLVGVADVHKWLQPGQIFACVMPVEGGTIYLEGPVVISRSPTIHPGDVQVVTAIGAPPVGSCFEKERLPNTVVFSVLGERPLPSCLGGGDLDGDIYNLIPLNNPRLSGFKPTKSHPASKYHPAVRRILDRNSTMKDVAEFVMDYIVSDVLGIIAINWLIIADQSSQGIFDDACLELANLHSDAVDYPKSGNPVDPKRIPRLKHKEKPDWNAPETVDLHRQNGKYYASQRAIGKLFREIDLPAEGRPLEGATRIAFHRRNRRFSRPDQRNRAVEWSIFANDPVFSAIALEVERFIAINEPFGEQRWNEGESLFARYTTELQGICITKTLSSARNASLTEEEAMIGTIVQKTSQPRRRKDMISRLRESTDILVRGIREVLEGSEQDTEEDYLQRSWFAWQVALDKGRDFGAQSFGWVALGAIFEAIRKIEEREEHFGDEPILVDGLLILALWNFGPHLQGHYYPVRYSKIQHLLLSHSPTPACEKSEPACDCELLAAKLIEGLGRFRVLRVPAAGPRQAQTLCPPNDVLQYTLTRCPDIAMGRLKQKGKAGAAKNFTTRTQAVKKLQISLADFRRLCILKGLTISSKSDIPTFIDALRDIDDALCMIFLFATLPTTARLPRELVENCARLSAEWQLYVMHTHSLRKVFFSIKGVYYQAEVMDQTITWLVPYSFTQSVPPDVDLRVMLTFLELYQTLLGFVHFKLYTDSALVYPPPLDSKKDEGAAGVGAFSLQTSRSQRQHPVEKVKSVAIDGRTITGKDVRQTIRRISNTGEQQDIDGALVEAESGNELEEAFVLQSSHSQVASELPTLQTLSLHPESTSTKLFAPYTFWISREVPRSIFEFLIRSCGGRAGWPASSGSGSPFEESDESITHVIVDRPVVGKGDSSAERELRSRRKYVQPQWVADSINAGKVLLEDTYAQGRALPPHLSPFGDHAGAYDPSAHLEVGDDVDMSDAEVSGEDAGSGSESDAGEDTVEVALKTIAEEGPAALRVAELAAEAAGMDYGTFESKVKKASKKSSKPPNSVEGAEDDMNKMMMSNKQRKLYEKVKHSQQKRNAEREKLETRRRAIQKNKAKSSNARLAHRRCPQCSPQPDSAWNQSERELRSANAASGLVRVDPPIPQIYMIRRLPSFRSSRDTKAKQDDSNARPPPPYTSVNSPSLLFTETRTTRTQVITTTTETTTETTRHVQPAGEDSAFVSPLLFPTRPEAELAAGSSEHLCLDKALPPTPPHTISSPGASPRTSTSSRKSSAFPPTPSICQLGRSSLAVCLPPVGGPDILTGSIVSTRTSVSFPLLPPPTDQATAHLPRRPKSAHRFQQGSQPIPVEDNNRRRSRGLSLGAVSWLGLGTPLDAKGKEQAKPTPRRPPPTLPLLSIATDMDTHPDRSVVPASRLTHRRPSFTRRHSDNPASTPVRTELLADEVITASPIKENSLRTHEEAASSSPQPRSQANPPLLHRLSSALFSLSEPPSSHASPKHSISSCASPLVDVRDIPKPCEDTESPSVYVSRLRSVVSRAEIAVALASSSEPFYAEALTCFFRRFNFHNEPLDIALRKLLMEVGLPRETQQIDRVMEAFSSRYSECNPTLFADKDHGYVLAFSLIMLHTDAFNPSNRSKMTKADYVKNTSLAGLPTEALGCYYDNIVFAPFIFIEDALDINGQVGLAPDISTKQTRGPSSPYNGGVLGKTKIDPYYLITHDLLESMQTAVEQCVPLDEPYTWRPLGNRVWTGEDLQAAFSKASVLEVQSPNHQQLSTAYATPLASGISVAAEMDSPQAQLPSSTTIRVSKVGVLNRKDDAGLRGKRTAFRKWRPWSVLLTGSQLLFYRDPLLARSVLRVLESDTVVERVTDSMSKASLVKPDEILSVKDAIAVYDRMYTKREHTIRLALANGRQLLLQASSNDDMDEWLTKINYASAFKTAGVRIRPPGMSLDEVHMTGVAAATAVLHDSQYNSPPAMSSARVWGLNHSHELMEMLSGESFTHRPSAPQRRLTIAPCDDFDIDNVSLMDTTASQQFETTFKRVQADLERQKWHMQDESAANYYSPPSTPLSALGTASPRGSTRASIVRTKIDELQAKLGATQIELWNDLRIVRNIAILKPFQRVTRARLLQPVQNVARRIMSLRLEVARLDCHLSVLQSDLELEIQSLEEMQLIALEVAKRSLDRETHPVPRMTISRAPSKPDEQATEIHPPRALSRSWSSSSIADSFKSALDYPEQDLDVDTTSSCLEPSHNVDPTLPLSSSPATYPTSNYSTNSVLRSSPSCASSAGELRKDTSFISEPQEEAEVWNRTRCAQRVSLIRVPSTLSFAHTSASRK
ncbi:hypothetical protein NMY22_g2621 [Coprinellus aureogranulatus]|nr:hypothetical protein NMY22_g2621 [Coprinellus aureogranulatus]